MKVERIDLLSAIENVFDDNIDVSVQLENGQNYRVVVENPKNLLILM